MCFDVFDENVLRPLTRLRSENGVLGKLRLTTIGKFAKTQYRQLEVLSTALDGVIHSIRAEQFQGPTGEWMGLLAVALSRWWSRNSASPAVTVA